MTKEPAKPLRVASSTRIGVSSLQGRERLKDILVIAEESGLFRGTRPKVVRGRMPEALVNKAKARTGIKSDTDGG